MKTQLCISEKLIFVCMGCQVSESALKKKGTRISQENTIYSIRLKTGDPGLVVENFLQQG